MIPEQTISTLVRNNEKRKKWNVVEGGQNNECHPVIKRALQIRNLECAVKEGVTKAQHENLIDSRLADLYQIVLNDEDKHKLQLDELAKHYGVGELDVRDDLYQKYLQISQTENPLMLNYAIELLVFINILPLFQRYGDPFAANVASWILLDEARHIAIGRAITQIYPLTQPAIKFALEVLKFVIGDLPEKSEIVANAKKSLERIPSTGLTSVVPPTINFFEVDVNSIKY